MIRCFTVFVILLLTQASIAQVTIPVAIEKDTGALNVVDPQSLTDEELISRLPTIEREQVRDTGKSTWVLNPLISEMRTRVERGDIDNHEMQQAFVKVGSLRTSPTWHKAKDFAIWFRLPKWLGDDFNFNATAKPSFVNSSTAHARSRISFGCGNAIAWEEEKESYQMVGVLPADCSLVDFEINIKASVWAHPNAEKWNFKITRPVRQIDAAPLKPVDDPAMLVEIRRLVNVSCANGYFNNGASVWLSSWFKRPPVGQLTSTVVVLELSILDGDNVLYTTIDADPDEAYGEKAWGNTKFFRGKVAEQIVNREELDRYSVRVRGIAPEGNSNLWCRENYWHGEFKLPLKEVMEPEAGLRGR